MSKSNILFVTYCSSEKSTTDEPLAAIRRYSSKRIKKVFGLAKNEGADFAILSGEYGLLKPRTKIPYYDHLLQEEEVEEIAKKSLIFLKHQGDYESIVFYSRPLDSNPQLKPYHRVLETSAEKTGIKLIKKRYPINNSE